MRTILSAIVIMLVTALGLPYNTWGQSAVTQETWSLPGAIDALKSGREGDRAAAKEYLLGLGSAAVDPLISVLRTTLETLDEPSSITPPVKAPIRFPMASSVRVFSDVRWTLIGDCCELLGVFRARSAIPFLIQIIERSAAVGTLSGCGGQAAALRALTLIGKPAEFALIEEFKNALQRAQSLIQRADSRLEELRSHISPAFHPAASAETATHLWSRECEETRRIQVQLGCVLEKMGDQGTTDALEDLLTSYADPCDTGKSIIENTISNIRMRPAFYLNRRN